MICHLFIQLFHVLLTFQSFPGDIIDVVDMNSGSGKWVWTNFLFCSLVPQRFAMNIHEQPTFKCTVLKVIYLFIYLFPFYFHRVALSVDKLIYKGALQYNTNNTNFDIQIYITNMKYEVGKITTYNVQKHNTKVKKKSTETLNNCKIY